MIFMDDHTIGIRPKWIRIESQTPPDYEYVLVYAHMKGTNEPCPISIAQCIKGEWEMLNETENNAVACGDLTWSMEAQDITHWLPLPKKPE